MSIPFPPLRSMRFYRSAIDLLNSAEIPFLVGGAFALHAYTGIERDTKDFDIMVRPSDVDAVLGAFRAAGYRADYAFTHWLAKVHHGEYFIDVIYRAGNGLGEVDDAWFERGMEAEVLGAKLKVCPPEEMIWQKSYIMERERFDGADVLHLMRACAGRMDWRHLIRRFGPDWRVLLSHCILFGFVYPGERLGIPQEVLRELTERLTTETATLPEKDSRCMGTLLSRAQYLPDVERWGYQDARNDERVRMTQEELEAWTNAVDRSHGAV